MTALRVVEPVVEDFAGPSTSVSTDPLVVRLDRLLAEFQEAAVDPSPVSDTDRIDRLDRLEKLRAATAGLQMAESVRFAQSQVERQLAADVHPERIGRGVAEQIGLACHLSPVVAARRLGVAPGPVLRPAGQTVCGGAGRGGAGAGRRSGGDPETPVMLRCPHPRCASSLTPMSIRNGSAAYHPADRPAGPGICRLSPARATQPARDLCSSCPIPIRRVTGRELSHDTISEPVAAETRHLDAHTRRQVDAESPPAGITGMGTGGRGLRPPDAYEADRAGYVARGRTERKHRRVGIRPAPDTMAILTGYLPVEQAAACYAGLRRHAARLKADGDERARTRSWPTPWSSCSPDRPGRGPRHRGPDHHAVRQPPRPPPPDSSHGRLRAAALDLAREDRSSQGRKWWRRLFTAPSGQLIGGDPTRRRFDGWLARLISLRDQPAATRSATPRSASTTTSSATPTAARPPT